MLNVKRLDKKIAQLKDRQGVLKRLLKDAGIEINSERISEPYKEFSLQIDDIHDLRMACVMDRFTLDSYAPECNILELTPNGWREEIDAFVPDLIFIESAWQGKDGLWYRKIANGSKEFFDMTSYCQEKNIPVVFWNKEDPIYTDVFMPAARMADVVFTTDIDCIIKYKQSLQHNRVYWLHFAAQPKVHNPIEKYVRKDRYCFAGAYYHRYPKRAEVFDRFAKVFLETKGFDIYDRNYKNALPEHAFPKFYDPYILGKLDPSEIDIAYKGYNYGVNMNSVTQSQTMFARRVFEMLASNTVTIGNYSRGVKNLFGDLTICTDDDKELFRELELFCSSEPDYRKYRLAGLRKVLKENLYEDRLNYVVEKVFGKCMKDHLPEIIVVSVVEKDQEDRMLRLFRAQKYEKKKLYLIGQEERFDQDVFYITKESAANILLSSMERNTMIAYFENTDYYGPNYLLDLVLTLRYKKCNGIGKACYFSNVAGTVERTGLNIVYNVVDELDIARSIFHTELAQTAAGSLADYVKLGKLQGDGLFSVDEFNYCENMQQECCLEVDDCIVEDQGIPLKQIQWSAENIEFLETECEGINLCAKELNVSDAGRTNSGVDIHKEENIIELNSQLEPGKHEYLYFDKLLDLYELYIDTNLNILFQGKGDLEIQGVLIFYGERKNKISPAFVRCSVQTNVPVPKESRYVRLGVKVIGTGKYVLKHIQMNQSPEEFEASAFLSRSNILVLANQYPSYDNLYRNMFVHKRLKSYKEDGLICDVMRMNIYSKREFNEFEGINVYEGQAEQLAQVLDAGYIDTVCVHFLDSKMWEVLRNYPNIHIIVWIHGIDIQPWWRRQYLYQNETELERGKKDSEVKMNFWRSVFGELEGRDIQFVFVSQQFADSIFEDYGMELPKNCYQIIHNCVDTEQFPYVEKNPEMRKKILSIRPYANITYANDLMVKTILELSKKPFFNELEFMIIGNGELFDEIVKPLRRFSNVKLIKRFLRQDEIAEYHKQYGVFLTPTRMDTQGVSRDEAMSAGLVPVTNAVAAVPEFVDETCAILAPGEDYMTLAEGIERLYWNAELFEKMSQNAAEKVYELSSKEHTIKKEEFLICKQ